MLQNVGSLFTGLLLIVNAASTDPSSDETSVCHNVSVPSGFKNIPSSDQDVWSFVAAPGNFMYVLYRNFHSDSENKGTNMCVMVQKVPYTQSGETKFANYTKWFNGTTNQSYAMRSFYAVVSLDGTEGATKNVLVARHQVGENLTTETCYPFAYTDAKCAVVLMNHWNDAAKNQCRNENPSQEGESDKTAPKIGN
uniref:Putative salivary lipocalin n=1 Tax=Ixodes ricinus TaxID=34613 RepID=A0A0K8R8B2_IXORI